MGLIELWCNGANLALILYGDGLPNCVVTRLSLYAGDSNS
jgi:hypothetical protein